MSYRGEDFLLLGALFNWDISFIDKCEIKTNEGGFEEGSSTLNKIKVLLTFEKTIEKNIVDEIEEKLSGQDRRHAFFISMYVLNWNKEKFKQFSKYKKYFSLKIETEQFSNKKISFMEILQKLAAIEHINKIYEIFENLTKNIDGKADIEEKYLKISEMVPSGCESLWLIDIQHLYKYAKDFFKTVDEMAKIHTRHNYSDIWLVIIRDLKDFMDTLSSKLLQNQVNTNYRINTKLTMNLMKSLKPKILNAFLQKYCTPSLESTLDILPVYSFTSEEKLLVIIKNDNNDNNELTSDINLLEQLFLQLGFKVEIYKDLTKQDMINTFSVFQQKKLSCFFLIVMGLGNNMAVRSVDGKDISFTNIVSYFDNKCANLLNKPKIFIFSTCGYSMERIITQKNQITYDLTNMSDILITYATIKDPKKASQFVKILCKVFKNNAAKMHIEQILKISIQKAMNENIEPPIYKSISFMNCYLLSEETNENEKEITAIN